MSKDPGPTYSKDAVLLGDTFAVFKKGQNLDSLRVLSDPRYRKPGSPFLMTVDLSYLNISILNFVCSNVYGVMLIANKTTANKLTLIQFYKDFTYEIRSFNNRYALSLEGSLAFTSTSDDGIDYYMAPSNPTPSSAFVSFHFSVRTMYPVVKLKKQPQGLSDIPKQFQAIVPVGDKQVQVTAQKVTGPDEEVFKKTSPIQVVTNNDIYSVDLSQHLELDGNAYFLDKTIDYSDPDYEKRPIRIDDLDSSVYLSSSVQFHSFAQGQANDIAVINFQSTKGDCMIQSYTV